MKVRLSVMLAVFGTVLTTYRIFSSQAPLDDLIIISLVSLTLIYMMGERTRNFVHRQFSSADASPG